MKSQSFFTVVSGQKYINFAIQLARSYELWNSPLSSVPFFIISNQIIELPKDLKNCLCIHDKADLVKNNLEFKLHLNILCPTKEGIFIDADCLVYDDIQYLFNLFKDDTFNVVGCKVIDGEWVDIAIADFIKKEKLEYLIRYNGGFYYLKKNSEADAVFLDATLSFKSEENLQKHHAGFNEEPLLSIAMSKFGIVPLVDDGNIICDLVHIKKDTHFNILNGVSEFKNPRIKETKNKFWMPEGAYYPKILHFGSSMYYKYPYIFERLRLYLLANHFPKKLITIIMYGFKRIYFTLKIFKRF